ncbi:MAG: FMN-binding protein [Pirellulales bacterium]
MTHPLPILDIAEPSSSANRHSRRGGRWLLLRIIRAFVIACLILGLQQLAEQGKRNVAVPPLSLSVIREAWNRSENVPDLNWDSLRLEVSDRDDAVWDLIDVEGNVRGRVLQTSPQSDSVVGYSGPNNVLLIADADGVITAASLLSSGDTRDHAERVRHADAFWKQFIGRRLDDPVPSRVDAVSGATLTSLAVAEAIAMRHGGERQSLKFPDPLTLEEVRASFENAAAVEEDHRVPGLSDVFDDMKQPLGSVLRTGVLADSDAGYQGPSELILAMDREGVIFKIRLRSSFDNEPYVRYAKQEARFWKKFGNRTLPELAQMDIDALGIEGVSGATMTSMAAARTLVMSAQRAEEARLRSETAEALAAKPLRWSIGEILTGLVACLILPISLTSLRGKRRFRIVRQVCILVILVVIAGNLLSLSLMAGWVRSGWNWRQAPGLALLSLIAIGSPLLLNRNVYCDHVCPHGIAQQWLSPWAARRRARVSPLIRRRLFQLGRLSAAAVFGTALMWIVTGRPMFLSRLEPFDTYVWRIGFSLSCIVWLLSLIWSAWEPMAYCRSACPTGWVLDTMKTSGDRGLGLFSIGCSVRLSAVCGVPCG